MTRPNVRREIWRAGEWVIEYRSQCPRPHFLELMGPCVIADSTVWLNTRKCWHERRPFSRNRTLMECLCEALDFVTKRNEEKAAADEQANLLAEEANALAEAAQSLATLSRA